MIMCKYILYMLISRASIILREEILSQVMTLVSKIGASHVHALQRQVTFLWESYFSSMRTITLTTLQIINDRVFPYAAKRYEEWNELPNKVRFSWLFYIRARIE